MDWETLINREEKKEYYQKLKTFVKSEYDHFICYPPYALIFNAFKLTPFDSVKVVILGQDPYHNVNQAHGLAFSVTNEVLPPSLKNIYKEMSSDLESEVNQDGNLEYLAFQGVLLLNTTLSVREHQPLSHAKKGWETFTDEVIKELDKKEEPMVFILWGANARSKTKYLKNPNHLILESAHPSPLSAYNGFFGSKPFSKCNQFLMNSGIKPIEWIK